MLRCAVLTGAGAAQAAQRAAAAHHRGAQRLALHRGAHGGGQVHRDYRSDFFYEELYTQSDW
jgi:hypothetical protein